MRWFTRSAAWLLVLLMMIAPVSAWAATGDIPIDEAHFPDEIFRRYVADRFDDGDGILTEAECSKAKKISVDPWSEDEDGKITSLKGIEHFPNLKTLEVEGFSGSVNLGRNTALKSVSIRYGSLTSLNVKKNKNLTSLQLEENSLTNLDVTRNTKLTSLYVRGNNLSGLNVRKNTRLKFLDVADNKLKSLDVSRNTRLTYLDCGKNKLGSLDVKKNTRLVYLVCETNRLSKLDLSANTKLQGLAVFGNRKLKKLDISACKTLQKAVKTKKLQTSELPEGVRCWGTYFENEMIEGLAINPSQTIVAGKKTLYKGK